MACSLLVAGCSDPSVEDDGVEVVASFYPIFEAVRSIAGDDIKVSNLTGAGVEPHDVELTPKQVDALADAEAVFYLRGFQPAVDDAVGSSAQAVDLLAGARALRTSDEGVDPHVWLDPSRWRRIVGRVATALSKLAPGSSKTFARNAGRYDRRLRVLDEDFEAGLARCDRREVVTSHEAFGYLADRYGLEELPITGISPEAEPTPARVAELADLVKSEGITTIFTESLVSPKVARALAREAGVRTDVLDPIEGLTEQQIASGADYASVMRTNLRTLRRAMGCR